MPQLYKKVASERPRRECYRLVFIQDGLGLPNLFKKQRLRFAVRTLSDRVLDDEEEDSDFGEDESETDTGEDETADEEFDDAIPVMARRLRPGKGGTKEDRQKIKAKISGENELEYYLSRRRKEELALVLKRIRAAVRVMDGVMPDDEVRAVAQLTREHLVLILY